MQLQVEQNSKNLKFLTKTKRHYAVCLKMFYRLLLLSRLFQYFHHGYSSKIYILSSCWNFTQTELKDIGQDHVQVNYGLLQLNFIWFCMHENEKKHFIIFWNNDDLFIFIYLGAACFGLPSGVFPFSVASKEFGKVVTMSVDCLHISVVENPA